MEFNSFAKGCMDKYSDIGCLIEELVSDNDKIKNEAWSYFIRQYGRLIYHCIKKVLSYKAPQEDIEDCFQDIIRKLLEDGCRRIKELHSYNEKAFRSWLGTIATRSAMNFSRRKKKELFTVPEEIISLIPDSSLAIDKETLKLEITDFIDKLPDQESLVMSLFLDGCTLEETAEIMELNLAKVFEIKQKALSSLKNILKGIFSIGY